MLFSFAMRVHDCCGNREPPRVNRSGCAGVARDAHSRVTEPTMKRHLMLLTLLAVGIAGTAAASDRRHDRDNNPPGPAGGPGTNWENPRGWRGGPGASPDYRTWRHDGKRYRFNRVAAGYYFSTDH